MDVKVEKMSPVKTRLTLTIDTDTVRQATDKVYKQLRREAQVPGFRRGKAPLALLKRRYGEYAEQEVKSDLVGEHLANAVEEHQLKLMGTPELEKDEFNDDGSLTVIAVMETKPEVELGEYKGIEITKEKPHVRDEAVEARLENMRQGMATTEEITDRDLAEKEDLVRVDLVGKKEGKPFKNGEIKDYMFELTDETLFPGLGEKVVGMKKGETKDIPSSLPEHFPIKEVAAREVVFTTTLHAIMRKDLPELDDEFAKDTGMAESLAELRQKIHTEMIAAEEERSRRQARKQLINKIIEMHPIEVPHSLVEEQINYDVRRFKAQMAMAGIPPQDDPAAEEKLRERVAEESKREVQAAFILDAISRAENIEVSDEEVQADLQRMAGEQDMPVEEISAYYQKQDMMGALRERLLEDKVVDFLLAQAKVTWEEAKAEPAEGEQAQPDREPGEKSPAEETETQDPPAPDKAETEEK